MLWYDWLLLIGLLYMLIGVDFSLNWLGGLAYGRRLSRNSTHPLKRYFYLLWIHYDPNTRSEDTAGTKEILPPWITAISVLNGTIGCILELLLILGFFLISTEFIRLAAFSFLFRGVVEFIRGAELIFGPARLKGFELAKYLLIGLLPAVYIPSFVAMRFSNLGFHLFSITLLVILPLVLFMWVALIYRRGAKDIKSKENP